MKNKYKVLAICLFFWSSLILAVQQPISLMENITNEVMLALRNNHEEILADPKKVYGIANKFIIPHVDFNEMAEWIAGRTIWRQTSEDTRASFIKEFKILLVRTYATALNKYTNETIKFQPYRGELTNRIQVSSKITGSDGKIVSVDYRLIKHGDTWLVYDMIIEGVSIIKGFQAQFSDRIKQEGFSAVIKSIRQHNNDKNE